MLQTILDHGHRRLRTKASGGNNQNAWLYLKLPCYLYLSDVYNLSNVTVTSGPWIKQSFLISVLLSTSAFPDRLDWPTRVDARAVQDNVPSQN